MKQALRPAEASKPQKNAVMSERLLRYCGLQFIIGAIAGTIGTLLTLLIDEKRFIGLMIIYMGAFFLVTLLFAAFRKLVLKKPFFPELP
jgi:sulfite exporter TauE/SafE